MDRFNIPRLDSRHLEVRLREIDPGDLLQIYEWQCDPESNRVAVTNPRSREGFEAHWIEVLSDPGVKVRAVLVRDELVGHVASFGRDGQTNVGYWLDRDFWGQGIANRPTKNLPATTIGDVDVPKE